MDIQNKIAKIESFLEKASRMHPAYKILIIIALILLMFAPGINEYLHRVFDPHVYYSDEMLYLPPFHQYLPDHTPSTYVKDYYLNAIMPVGFQVLMKFIYTNLDAHLWIGLIKIANLLTIVILVGMVAWELGGALICFATISWFFYSPWMFYQSLNGMTPRIFVFTFIVAAILCIIRKRIYVVGTLVIFSALFYPQAAFIMGVAMAIWLLCLPKNNPVAVNNWSFLKKIIILATTALITVTIVLPQIIAASAYGRRMTEADLTTYPEIGTSGRYLPVDSFPYGSIMSDFVYIILFIFIANSAIFLITLFPCVLFATCRRIFASHGKYPKDTAVFILLYTGLILNTLAHIVSPYLYMPNRYFYFTIPIFTMFILPISCKELFHKYLPNRNILSVIAAALLIVSLSLSGGMSITTGLEKERQDRFKAYHYIDTMSKDIVMAGWPAGLVDNMQFFTRKNAFLTNKTHDVLHKNELEEMRRRMYAIMDVYFSKSPEPLLRLRDEFKVTHFIVDKKYFVDQEKLVYFEPFMDTIKEKLKDFSLKDGVLMSDAMKPAIIYEDEDYLIIDLKRL